MRGRGSLSFEYYNNTISAVDCKPGNPQTTLSFGGGTGVIFNNTYTGTTWNSGGYLEIHSYRTYAEAGIYGKCDGTSSYDGNLPLNGDTATYTGTHTGSDGQTVLTCAGKSWTPDGLVYLAVWNLTDLSVGLITTNTANTITVTLDNGKRNNWNNGDSFKVTNGYPCMDGPGRGVNGPDVNQSGMPIQLAEPVYEWNNTYNGENLDFHHYWTSELHPEYVVEGRDYYNDTQRPGYTPYTYPHPLQTILGDDPDMTMSSGMPR